MRATPLPALLALLVIALLSGCNLESGADRDSPPRARQGPGEGPVRSGEKLRLETVASGLDVPWEIAFLPDGRALVTERPGTIRMLEADGTLRSDPVGQVPVTATEESGLLGLAVDPKFEQNRLLYVYRTLERENQVVRYRLQDGKLGAGKIVLDGIVAAANHDGGRIHFGPDGALYVATGDAQDTSLPQDRDSLNGKLLRLRDFRSGKGRPEIFSLGHRNVQGFDWDAEGRMFATEFGEDSDDEVNLIERGRNYGWPEVTGKDGRNGFTPAFVNYEDVIAPSGATFVSKTGSAWSGDFVFANLIGEQIRRLEIDGNRVIENEKLFEGELGRVRTVVEGPDGALYALTNNRDGRGQPSEGDDRIIRIVPPAA